MQIQNLVLICESTSMELVRGIWTTAGGWSAESLSGP